jgi:hypothetical protein
MPLGFPSLTTGSTTMLLGFPSLTTGSTTMPLEFPSLTAVYHHKLHCNTEGPTR